MTRLRAVVTGVAALGATLATLVALLPATRTTPTPALTLALLALTVAGELTYVRLRHGGSTEELTLFEAAVVVDVLLLPPALAVGVPVLALAVASAVRRRPPVKAVFNLGSYAASTAVMVGTVTLVARGAEHFAPMSVVALTLGTAGFAVVNLACLAQVLAVVEDVPARRVFREGVRLSGFMALGNVALGTVAVAVAQSAPALLPFTALPAVALRYAYRAAAQEADERDRSAHLTAVSHLLAAGGDDLVEPFLAGLTRVFRGTGARAELRAADGVRVVSVGDCAGRAVSAPVEADGPLGTVTVYAPEGPSSLLAPLASALGAALRAAEEGSKLAAVVEHSSDGIYVLDDDGRVLVWNAAIAAATGLPAGEVVGRAGREVVPADVALTPEAPHAVVELSVTRPDGEVRWLRCAHAGIFEGRRLLRDVVIAHDVTRQRQVDRLKSDFIATVSHELRTPVTPIKGYVDLLRRRGDALTPAKRTECLDIVADRVAHLGRLVEDLLLASRISAEGGTPHRLDNETVDLGRLVRRAAADFAAAGARLSVVAPPAPVLVTCDPTRAVQIVGNLVSNALKYSADDAPVTVAVSAHDGQAAVTVTDRGRGIPADQVERVFDKFHRVEDPMTMTTGGTGLGLYIARELAEAMGGGVVAHSTLGVGSTFTFTLPRAADLPRPVVPAPRGAYDSTPLSA